MATKAHLEGNKRYLEKLDELKVRTPKGKKETIQAHAEKQGESVNGFINRAIDNQIDRDNTIPQADASIQPIKTDTPKAPTPDTPNTPDTPPLSKEDAMDSYLKQRERDGLS